MPRRLTAKEIISVLSENGFCLIGQKGSHQKWQNAEIGAVTIVPCCPLQPFMFPLMIMQQHSLCLERALKCLIKRTGRIVLGF